MSPARARKSAGTGVSTPEFWEAEAQRLKGDYEAMEQNRDATYSQWLEGKRRIRELGIPFVVIDPTG